MLGGPVYFVASNSPFLRPRVYLLQARLRQRRAKQQELLLTALRAAHEGDVEQPSAVLPSQAAASNEADAPAPPPQASQQDEEERPTPASAAIAQLAAGVAAGVDDLFDVRGSSGLFLASDGLEDVPDVFGSAYLVKLGLSTQARRESVAAFLAGQWRNSSGSWSAASPSSLAGGGVATTTVFQEGQVRHLPYPDVWKQCWGSCPSPGTYQNGERSSWS